MNEYARKQARRAELEFFLLGVWKDDWWRYSFVDWLEMQLAGASWRDEAIELIALYGE